MSSQKLSVCQAMEGRMLLSAGVLVASDLVAMSAPTTASITSYTLVNAGTDTDIGPLTEGMTLDLAKLPRGLNVRANTTGPAKSVRLTFDNTKRLELQAPWALFGDWFGDYVAGNLGDGSHTITAQAFTGTSGSGTPGPLNILHIKVINQPPSGVLSGTIYKDLNLSGLRSAGEPGLAGIRAYLDLNKDGIWQGSETSALSAADGSYRFHRAGPRNLYAAHCRSVRLEDHRSILASIHPNAQQRLCHQWQRFWNHSACAFKCRSRFWSQWTNFYKHQLRGLANESGSDGHGAAKGWKNSGCRRHWTSEQRVELAPWNSSASLQFDWCAGCHVWNRRDRLCAADRLCHCCYPTA